MFCGAARCSLLKLYYPVSSPSVLKRKQILFPPKSTLNYSKAADREDDREGEIPEKAKGAAERAEEALKEGSESAKERGEMVKEKTKEDANSAAEKAKETAQTTKEKAEELSQTTKEKTEDSAETGKEKTKDGLRKAAEMAENVGEKAKETVKGAWGAAKETTQKIKETMVGKDDHNDDRGKHGDVKHNDLVGEAERLDEARKRAEE